MRRQGQDNPDPKAAGERLVFYAHCTSLMLRSLRRPSAGMGPRLDNAGDRETSIQAPVPLSRGAGAPRTVGDEVTPCVARC